MNKFKHCLTASTGVMLVITMTALAIMLTGVNAWAQSTTVFATGLKAPTKIIFSQNGNLLVAEAGDGPNTGRVSIVDRNGNRRTLLDGLPAGLAAPNLEPSGPEGLVLNGNTLYITIGIGDVVRAGSVPGTEVPNPNGPSSPILSSVMAVHFDSSIDFLSSSFTLSVADHFTLADGFEVALQNNAGERNIQFRRHRQASAVNRRLVSRAADFDKAFGARAGQLARRLIHLVKDVNQKITARANAFADALADKRRQTLEIICRNSFFNRRLRVESD